VPNSGLPASCSVDLQNRRSNHEILGDPALSRKKSNHRRDVMRSKWRLSRCFLCSCTCVYHKLENLAVKEDRHFDYKDCPSVVAR
jgi:hypothetical protein